jgi:cytochrome c biogenesis protein CcmG, thiol:disulfide interchange protein DsbE
MQRALYLLPLLLFAAIAGYFAYPILTGKDPHTLPSAMIDKPAPAHDLPPLIDGKPGIAAGDLKGEVRLVNFFASWCGPCRIEHPILMRIAAEGRVPLWGIDYKDTPEAGRRFLAELGDPYARIGTDRSGRAAIDWGVYGVPETYVVDREGHIRYRHVGPLSAEVVRGTIVPLLDRLRKGG